MFEVINPNTGKVTIGTGFRNYSVVRYLDLSRELNAGDYPFTPTTLVFARVLSTSGVTTTYRYAFCELNTSPARTSAGMELYSADGSVVYSSEEPYIKILRKDAVTLSDPKTGSYTGTLPASTSGGYVYASVSSYSYITLKMVYTLPIVIGSDQNGFPIFGAQTNIEFYGTDYKDNAYAGGTSYTLNIITVAAGTVSPYGSFWTGLLDRFKSANHDRLEVIFAELPN